MHMHGSGGRRIQVRIRIECRNLPTRLIFLLISHERSEQPQQETIGKVFRQRSERRVKGVRKRPCAGELWNGVTWIGELGKEARRAAQPSPEATGRTCRLAARPSPPLSAVLLKPTRWRRSWHRRHVPNTHGGDSGSGSGSSRSRASNVRLQENSRWTTFSTR